MFIRHIKISNFRGIRSLEWAPAAGLVALVGHGDSTKTTILDAIELTLAGRFNQTISDADFFNFDTSTPAVVEVSVAGVPDELLTESRYGLLLRGWESTAKKLHDEPADFEPVLTIRFQATKSMEPLWAVVNDRDPDGKPFRSGDRALLSVMRIGADINRHLAWGRGSALTRATEGDEGLREVLSDAGRQARESIAGANMPTLKAAAEKAQTAATAMGAIVRSTYGPGLGSLSGQTSGMLGLHDGPVPVTSSGLGSRRLVAIAIETLAVSTGGILLIDEIETGLEPHRLRHLLKQLRGLGCGQVFFTTHSEVALLELRATDLHVVRNAQGVIEVAEGTKELQPILRAVPEAFLGHRILVAEGRTELGLARGIESLWETAKGKPLTHTGAVVVDGNGSHARQRACHLARLGFAVALFVDADVAAPDAAWEKKNGVRVLAWEDAMCTEQRVMTDLPVAALSEAVQLAANFSSRESILVQCQSQPVLSGITSLRIEDWIAAGVSEADVRRALGQVSKVSEWFKRFDKGQALGALIAENWTAIADAPLGQGLDSVAAWLYAE